MAKTKTAPFDAADYLDSPEMIAHYLSEAFATGDARYMLKAIGTVARARGMSGVATGAALSRTNLYKAFGETQHPEFETVIRVLAAMNVQLSATVRDENS
jgi:probable addiction module antidote protein